jgi:hypothetical protein
MVVRLGPKPGTLAQHRQFDGEKAILVLVSLEASHAVRNLRITIRCG